MLKLPWNSALALMVFVAHVVSGKEYAASSWAGAPQAAISCRSCRHQATLTAGTILEQQKLPLTTWFLAFYTRRQAKTESPHSSEGASRCELPNGMVCFQNKIMPGNDKNVMAPMSSDEGCQVG